MNLTDIKYSDFPVPADEYIKSLDELINNQKLIQENDNLRIYRNVYQKLLLRTRRNPSNTKYAREFEIFKDDNNKWRENISKGKCTEKEYIEWLKKQ